MYRLIILLFIVMVTQTAYGQNERKFVRSGNKLFMEAVKDTSRLDTTKFGRAEEFYRKALDKKPDSEKWNFNLADAMYKQMRFEEAERKFNTLTEKLETKEEKARALHNQGNSQLMQQKIDESNFWNQFAQTHHLKTTIGSDFHCKDNLHPEIGLIQENIHLSETEIHNMLEFLEK